MLQSKTKYLEEIAQYRQQNPSKVVNAEAIQLHLDPNGLDRMDYDQLKDMMHYILEHHKYGNPDKGIKNKQIRDMDINQDIRFPDTNYIWAITFRGYCPTLQFRYDVFRKFERPLSFKYNSLFEWIMGWLKDEWKEDPSLHMRIT